MFLFMFLAFSGVLSAVLYVCSRYTGAIVSGAC